MARAFFSAPLGHGFRTGVIVQLGARSRRTATTEVESYLALADAYARIEKLPEAYRAKATLAIETLAAQRAAQLAKPARTWPWWIFLFVMLALVCWWAASSPPPHF